VSGSLVSLEQDRSAAASMWGEPAASWGAATGGSPTPTDPNDGVITF
jgi:hypothetical protein